MLEAGEALFLPVHWWHRVETLETSVSVNFWWAPPLNLLLDLQWAAARRSPESVFADVHALADLSSFESEFDVVECLGSEGFERHAAAYLGHCLSIVAATDRAAAESLQSIRRRCQRVIAQLDRGRRRVPRARIPEIGALVNEARRLAARLGCTKRLRPSRRVAPPAHREIGR